MSVEATSYVFKHSSYRGMERLIHLAIADVVNDTYNNECWIGLEGLATKAGCSKSTVTTTLAKMIQNHDLELVTKGGGRNNRTTYRFLFRRETVQSPDSLETVQSRPETVQSRPETVQSSEPSPIVNSIELNVLKSSLREALVQSCNLDTTAMTKPERIKLANAAKALAEIDVLPEEVLIRATVALGRWGDSKMVTPTSLVRNWSSLAASAAPGTEKDAITQEERQNIDGLFYRWDTLQPWFDAAGVEHSDDPALYGFERLRDHKGRLIDFRGNGYEVRGVTRVMVRYDD